MAFPLAIYVTSGVLSTLAHVLMMCTIYFNETLKSPVYVYVFFVALNDVLYTEGFIIYYFTQSFFVVSLHLHIIQYVFVTIAASIRATLIILLFKLPVKPNMYTRFILSIQISTYFIILAGIAIIYFLESPTLIQAVKFFDYGAFPVLCIVFVVNRITKRTEHGEYRLQLNFVLIYIILHVLKYIMKLINHFLFENELLTLTEFSNLLTFLYGLVNIVALASFDKSFRFALLKCAKSNSSGENNEDIPLQTLQGES